jgi:signal transduction histidine kinase/ActR/RegA family two-component response regulator
MKRIQEWIDNAGSAEDLVKAWRLTILNGLLWAFVLLGLPVALNHIFLKQTPFGFSMIAYYIVVAVAFIKRTDVNIRGCIVLGALYIAGISEMHGEATLGAYRIIFTVLVCYAVLFFGLRGGIFTLILAVAAMIGFGTAFVNGTLALEPPLNELASDPNDWFSKGLTFVFLAGCLMVSTSYLQSSFFRVVDRFKIQIDELQTQRDASEKLRDQLHHSQRMESVGQLAGGIAHDFNNLLQGILGYGEMATSKVPDTSPVRDDIEQMIDAGERAKVLVRQLLAFSRQQVLELSDVNLNYVIGDSVKLIQRVIGEHITFDYISGKELGIVRADRGQIEQILMNLCVNARDAMGDSGRLTIETRSTELDDEFCSANDWAVPGRYVMLTVSDTGSGISKDVQERMFEPFYTTKEQGKGTGLGLSTVFGIVGQHEGMIHVYSEIDIGTTFKIYFPTVNRLEDASEIPIPASMQGGIETILVADDERVVLEVAEAMLVESGYTVLKASDGEEAIEMFDEHVDKVDMVLLDVVMPKLSGKAVADHIYKHNPDFPILFSSGYSNDAVHTNFVLDDGMQLIQKPYNRADLLRRIRDVIEDRV